MIRNFLTLLIEQFIQCQLVESLVKNIISPFSFHTPHKRENRWPSPDETLLPLSSPHTPLRKKKEFFLDRLSHPAKKFLDRLSHPATQQGVLDRLSQPDFKCQSQLRSHPFPFYVAGTWKLRRFLSFSKTKIERSAGFIVRILLGLSCVTLYTITVNIFSVYIFSSVHFFLSTSFVYKITVYIFSGYQWKEWIIVT